MKASTEAETGIPLSLCLKNTKSHENGKPVYCTYIEVNRYIVMTLELAYLCLFRRVQNSNSMYQIWETHFNGYTCLNCFNMDFRPKAGSFQRIIQSFDEGLKFSQVTKFMFTQNSLFVFHFR